MQPGRRTPKKHAQTQQIQESIKVYRTGQSRGEGGMKRVAVQGGWNSRKTGMVDRFRSESRFSMLLVCSLLSERPPAHLKNVLEAFFSPVRVLRKPVNGTLFDLALDPLPPSTKSRNLGCLFELRLGLRGCCRRPIYNGLLYAE